MPIEKRAAQFSPFAVLSGYSLALNEVTRHTEEKRTFGEDEKAFLDQKFNILMEHLEEKPEITVTYFVPDAKKSGGQYVNTTGYIEKINKYRRLLVMDNGTRICFDDISDLSGEIISGFF